MITPFQLRTPLSRRGCSASISSLGESAISSNKGYSKLIDCSQRQPNTTDGLHKSSASNPTRAAHRLVRVGAQQAKFQDYARLIYNMQCIKCSGIGRNPNVGEMPGLFTIGSDRKNANPRAAGHWVCSLPLRGKKH